jgi:hypothetical protein
VRWGSWGAYTDKRKSQPEGFVPRETAEKTLPTPPTYCPHNEKEDDMICDTDADLGSKEWGIDPVPLLPNIQTSHTLLVSQALSSEWHERLSSTWNLKQDKIEHSMLGQLTSGLHILYAFICPQICESQMYYPSLYIQFYKGVWVAIM